MMRERLKVWKAIHHPPTVFNMVVAPNRREATIVSRHMAPVKECGGRPKRRRLMKGKAWNNPLQYLFAFEKSLTVPETTPLKWHQRLWLWLLSFFRERSRITHVISGSSTWGKPRRGATWETPTRCDCGVWKLWISPGGRRPNWCPDCEGKAKDRIRDYNLSKEAI